MHPLHMYVSHEDYSPPETLSLRDIAPRSIDRVPLEIWHRIFDFLPTSQVAITAVVSRDFLEAAQTWDRWINICLLNGLKGNRHIYKSEMTLVCSESYFICDLCDKRTTGEGRFTSCQIPIPVLNKADNGLIWRLCAHCRTNYYKAFPDDESILHGIASDVMVSTDWVRTHLCVDLVDIKVQESEAEALAENRGPIGYRLADGSTVFRFWDMVKCTKEIHGGWVGFAAAKNGKASTLRFMLQLRKARDETLALLRRRQRSWLQKDGSYQDESVDILTYSGDEEEDMETLFDFQDEGIVAPPRAESKAVNVLRAPNESVQTVPDTESISARTFSSSGDGAATTSALPSSPTEITSTNTMEFYEKHQVVLLTGGTGFVGKALLEKILRSLPQVKKAADESSLRNRVNKEIFDCPLFGPLKAQFKNDQEFQDRIVAKVVPLLADLTLEDLGLSTKVQAMVQADTSVVLNCAADVGYHHSFKHAVKNNCYGPLHVFQLAQGMPNLASLVHVSSSYVNGPYGPQLREVFYPYPLGDPDQLFKAFETMSDEEMSRFEKDIVLKVFSNTYTASKALTEHLIKTWTRTMDLPVVIVRPAGCTGALLEPMPGWVEGLGSYNGITLMMALGKIDGMIGSEHHIVDLIPVDYVCKIILMAATQAQRGTSMVPIFQVGTSSHHAISFRYLHNSIMDYWRAAKKATQDPKSKIVDNVQAVMYPSYIDFHLQFLKRFSKELELLSRAQDGAVAGEVDREKIRRRLLQAYRIPKLHYPFSSTQWVLDASNAVGLDAMAPEPLKCGMKREGNWFDWDEYLYVYNRGLHEFALKEKVERTTRPSTKESNSQKGEDSTGWALKNSIQSPAQLDDGIDMQEIQRNLDLLSRL
ncbi:alcohol-forming fatty acyl-CoA reductase [Entomortierella parvispora]|uniref:Fatty acyl-CoA reductase n=1 Tax=Entomortierella parvispora TaxID=205924 RepID=A0A9P3LRS7_9FUNG|nr:alcohol-forming fatty acyl-CoA reductase [Entomortierella parvispora]